MAKGQGKSSATSATRKKHQKKVATSLGIDLDNSSVKSQSGTPKSKGRGKKDGRKEPRIKAYIPPMKPARAQPDPLDVGGLARRLPPELVVVLKNIGKKAQVTKIRALEELGGEWVEKALKLSGQPSKQLGHEGAWGTSATLEIGMDVISSLVEMIPAWIHYIPSLFIHPSRRVRLLAISVHANLLKVLEVREQILFHLRETATSDEIESVMGSWCVLMYDIEKTVASVGREAWNSFVRNTSKAPVDVESLAAVSRDTQFLLDTTSENAVFGFVQRAVMDPLGLYGYLNPLPESNAPTPLVPVSKNQRAGGGNKGATLSKQQQLAAAIASARKGGSEERESIRSKTEEYDEGESDRKARLRIGGLGGLRWFFDQDGISDEALMLLSNPLLWTVLHHAEQAPYLETEGTDNFRDTEGFGFGQPNVRKAGWYLLMKLLEGHKENVPSILPVLSCVVLRSAWVEPDPLVQGVMWQPLLIFLKDFSSCWDVELARCYSTDSQGDDGGNDDDDDDENGEPATKPQEILQAVARPSVAYQEFLQFLQLGCSGSPVQGYPTVVIILSTIPSSIIASTGTKTPLADLFTSLWAALDGHALSSLHRAATSASLLSAVLESVVHMSRRLLLDMKKTEEGDICSSSILLSGGIFDVLEEARNLIRGQFGRAWEEIRTGRLKVDERAGAILVGQNLDALKKMDSSFLSGQGEGGVLKKAAWDLMKIGLGDATRTNPTLVATFLKVLLDHFKEDTESKDEVRELVRVVLENTVQQIVASIQADDWEGVQKDTKFLEHMLEQFREGLFDDIDFAQRLGEIVRTYARTLLERSTTLICSYLVFRNDEGDVLAAWHAILDVLTAYMDDEEKMFDFAMEVIQVVQKGHLPSYLGPRSSELDDIFGRSVERVLSGNLTSDAGLGVVKAALALHGYFISGFGFMKLVERIASAANIRIELLLGSSLDHNDLVAFQVTLELLDLVALHINDHEKTILDEVLPNVFLFGYLAPECAGYGFDPEMRMFSVARRIWERETNALVLSKERRNGIVASVKMKLRDLFIDTEVQLLPEEILAVLNVQGPKLGVRLLDDLFPSSETLDGIFRKLSHDPIDASLAVVDSLIPPGIHSPIQGPKSTDTQGFSPYARIITALLRVFLEDRNLAKQNLWALRHFIALSIYASDYQKVPGGISPVFDNAALTGLGEIIIKVQQITAYLFLGSIASAPNGWGWALARRIIEGKHGHGGTLLEEFVEDAIIVAAESDSILDIRVLKIVLENILEELDAQEADEWIGLARRLERSAPETSMAIITVVGETRAEPTRLDRFRNEQAAAMLGIKPSNINTTGLLTLRRLAAAAPDLESAVVFLPQNRAVNVIKACQSWVTSDDVNIDEEVESAMTLVFIYLVPILQNIPGSHWEFIWDVLENNLEMSSITDNNTISTLVRSLRLVIIVEDLVKTNKLLMTEWGKRRENVLKMIRDHAVVKLDTLSPSYPRSICRELLLSILRELPESLVDESTLSKMCHLLMDHSLKVQRLSYGILRTAARKRTEHLVIEAGVDIDSNVKATFPSELLDILQGHINILDDEEEQQSVIRVLLGWMLLFDLFQDASLKVKSGYIEQLRNLELINKKFVPLFLTLLRLVDGLEKAFKLGVWAVDNFYIDLLEPGTPVSIPLLMAHIYYRALLSAPTLIYSWLSNCKDRQLSTTVTSYTSQHFSPVIIEAELVHVKGPAGQELSDDSMSIKVASAVNEVMASYLVDEHQLEIKLKIPADWPLHKIEVKDVKRVGVDQDRWRAWILAIQQTIWSHNGRITDGLSLFKRNATLHFEGQVECAICYSIISVMDGSLPKKPCRTCRNKFHAACLYKWFHTSNASTCPLCRSEIILG